jgi:hypothetical protein
MRFRECMWELHFLRINVSLIEWVGFGGKLCFLMNKKSFVFVREYSIMGTYICSNDLMTFHLTWVIHKELSGSRDLMLGKLHLPLLNHRIIGNVPLNFIRAIINYVISCSILVLNLSNFRNIFLSRDQKRNETKNKRPICNKHINFMRSLILHDLSCLESDVEGRIGFRSEWIL